MILPITKIPSAILTGRARPVSKFDAALKKLISDMKNTLKASKDPEGVGLAAPQVAVNKRLFIMRADKKAKISEFINPVILKLEKQNKPKTAKKEKATFEGCLSVDKIWSPIQRPERVLLEYFDLNKVKTQKWFAGFEATIIQHELDHLDGILFTRRAVEQKAPIYEERNGKLKEIEF